jgi:hypothetical protein
VRVGVGVGVHVQEEMAVGVELEPEVGAISGPARVRGGTAWINLLLT